jgi:glycine/D-amino acid oxidase-like deaminating enzyme
MVIVGAGIGGLATALSLQRRGIAVTVFEQAPALGEVGAGVMLSPNATRVLLALGLADELRRIAFQPTFTAVRDGVTGELLARATLGDDGFHHADRPRSTTSIEPTCTVRCWPRCSPTTSAARASASSSSTWARTREASSRSARTAPRCAARC